MKTLRPLLFGWLAVLPAAAWADDAEAIKAALGRAINGPGQTLAEVRDFAEARIPAMPRVASADEWRERVWRYRKDVYEKVLFRGEAARWREAPCGVTWLETLEGGPGYRIKKLRYEVIPGLWIPALLYEPSTFRGKVPVVLNVNGHDAVGKAAPYKQIRCINQAKSGMIALNVEWFGMGQLRGPGFRHGLINAIDLGGSSGIALHYLAMKRGIDILCDQPNADTERVAVTGLSGGGWQTIFVSPLDPRVTLTDPVAGYSSFRTRARHPSDLGDSEQTPCDLATVVDYTHLTAMMAPHPTLLTFNARDNCCFAAGHALPPLIEAAAPIFALFGKGGNLRAHVNHDPGTHNYEVDNRQALYQVLSDAWSEPGAVINPKEVPSDAEVKTADQLQVELPSDNASFQSIALALGRDLPRAEAWPDRREGSDQWRESRRLALRGIVRPFDEKVEAERSGHEEQDGLTINSWKLRVGATWTVPAVELARGEPSESVILVADGGRKKSADLVGELLARGRRVLAVDPFYFGESELPDHAYLYALLVGTVGERPLGIEAGQLMAAARWLQSERGGKRPLVVASGPRTSLIALVAAALEPSAIGGVELRQPPGSLKEVLEQGKDFEACPEVFCFGLLKDFDVKGLAALVAPRPVRLKGLSDRARTELEGLKRWYATLGEEFEPIE